MAAGDPIRVLCVHGVGRGTEEPKAENAWSDALWHGLSRADAGARLEVRFLHYVDAFGGRELTALDCLQAVGKLSASWVTTTVGEMFSTRGARGDLKDDLRWTAGMVVQWVEDDALRRATRARLATAVASFRPDVVFAHSLGSLIAYDTFRHLDTRASVAGRTFVSFGSQIGNRAVAKGFGGRIEALPDARFWHHLFNAEDACFTARLKVRAANFAEIDAFFDIEGVMDHDATQYLEHRCVSTSVWAPLVESVRRTAGRALRPAAIARAAARVGTQAVREPNRRALLVGVDAYPDPSMRLEGCVGDVYSVSQLLQEHGFGLDAAPRYSRRDDEIRVLLDQRATAQAIRDRLAWLLDDARPGDVRLFYYSGHGAQIPGYGPSDSIDRLDECLVPHDFDWSRDRAVLDDQLYEQYSQLDYRVRFVMVLDCCHSGGMSRDGGPRVRGLTPPDDVRHRMLRWDPRTERWRERELRPEVERSAFGDRAQSDAWLGAGRSSVRRLGRAYELRAASRRAYNRARDAYEHRGPFLPIVLQACREDERAFEHREGARSGGAFTTSLVRLARDSGGAATLGTIERQVGARCRALGYEQHPVALFPKSLKGMALEQLFRPPEQDGDRAGGGARRARTSRR